MKYAGITAGISFGMLLLASPAMACTPPCTTTHCNGINVSGGDFATAIYPDHASMDWAASKGMSVIRVPFKWERIQPGGLDTGTWSNPPLDTAAMAILDEVVAYADSKNLTVLWDVHSYAQYKNPAGASIVLGTTGFPLTAMADFWRLFAQHYVNSTSPMLFGLMNEPTRLVTPSDWRSAVNSAIAAIRSTGSTSFITVGGPEGSSLANFQKNASFKTLFVPGANASTGVFDSASADPLHPTTWGLELHQYFDATKAGVNTDCKFYWGNATPGGQYDTSLWFSAITTWARSNNVKLFLGEFAAGAPPHTGTAQCEQNITNIVQFIKANQDAWTGWTWWADGAFGTNYFFYMGPKAVPDVPQFSWVAGALP